MDDKSFATNIIEKTVEKLNSESDLNKDFSVFKDIFEQCKYNDYEEILNAVKKVVENNDKAN